MGEFKRGYLPTSHGIHLFKNMCLKTKIERYMMEKTSYASTIRSIIYMMLCTRPYVPYALIITSRYQSNSGEGH